MDQKITPEVPDTLAAFLEKFQAAPATPPLPTTDELEKSHDEDEAEADFERIKKATLDLLRPIMNRYIEELVPGADAVTENGTQVFKGYKIAAVMAGMTDALASIAYAFVRSTANGGARGRRLAAEKVCMAVTLTISDAAQAAIASKKDEG